MIVITRKKRALQLLSTPARLLILLDEASTDEDKFILYVQHATSIAKRIANDDEHTNLTIIMHKIKSALDNGINPNAVKNGLSPIFHALTYPELVKLLLTKGADPNLFSHTHSTPMHHVAMLFRSDYKKELLITAELLAASGGYLYFQNDWGDYPLDNLKTSLRFFTHNNMDDRKIELHCNEFKRIASTPKLFDDIKFESLADDEAPSKSLILSESDLIKIALYKEGQYEELIKQDPVFQFTSAISRQYSIQNRCSFYQPHHEERRKEEAGENIRPFF